MSLEVGEARGMSAHGEAKRAVARRSGALARALCDVRLLLVALWLGAAVFFSAAVAPNVFRVLRGAELAQANHLAGSIITSTLALINTSGFIIALVLLGSAFLFREVARRRAFMLEILALAILAVTTALGQWYVAARMLALRGAMGRPIDEVGADDPLRIAFNSLHSLSVMALGLGIIAAAVALLLIARRGRLRNSW
ncbi:MAG TPA: DUF4149 domain-containing protein [Pyrinomonadaceae bacterium]|jgi:hypothetical protein